MGSSALKKPTGVYLIAILFIFAPLGNIIISFIGSGIKNWYDVSVFIPFLQTISALDWAWLALLFITGFLLLRPHKLTWSLAIMILIFILTINSYRLYTTDSHSIDPTFFKVFSILALVCTLSFLVIAFYFRFPYLDRRANWFTNVKRFNLRTPAKLNARVAVTESISTTGCRVSFDKPSEFKKSEQITIVFDEISKNEVMAEIVECLEFGVRVEFRNITSDFKLDLDRWLSSHIK